MTYHDQLVLAATKAIVTVCAMLLAAIVLVGLCGCSGSRESLSVRGAAEQERPAYVVAEYRAEWVR